MIHACHLSFELLSDFIRSPIPSTATDFFQKKCHKQSLTKKFHQDRESLTDVCTFFIIYCIFWYPENIQMWRKNGTRGPRPVGLWAAAAPVGHDLCVCNPFEETCKTYPLGTNEKHHFFAHGHPENLNFNHGDFIWTSNF